MYSVFRNTNFIYAFLAILISGGVFNEKSVEAFRSDWSPLCSLADLPDVRDGHTMDGDLICGGGDSDSASETSCLQYGVGGWSKHSWSLQQRRSGAVSWRLPNGGGVQIMGGWDIGGGWNNSKTSEIVTSAGSQKGFDLKYRTE